jgi:PAS domain S-box-containing protein
MLANFFQNRAAGYLSAVLGIAVVTAVSAPFHDQLNDTTVALALVLVVLFAATLWGRGPGIVAAVVGMLCFKFFFLPPPYTLTIADPQNWIALAAFIITASTAGHLSVTAKRRAAEAEAERKAARLASAYNRSLIEASLDPLVTIGPDGKITDVNAATETVTGHSRVELIGTDFSDYFTEPEKARAGYQQAFHEGFMRDYALELRHRDGGITAVLYNASLYRDESGKAMGVFAAARDITERKRAEQALRLSEANLNRAQEIAHLGSWCLDVSQNRLTWSDEVFRIFGIPKRPALTYEDFLGMVHPEDREFVDKAWTAAMHGAPYHIEHRIVVAGALKWVRERAKVEFDKNGNAVEGIGTVQDITERKRAADEIRLLARLQAEVAELGQRALRGTPLVDVLDEAVTRIARALGVEYCKVLELLPGREALLLRSGVGWKPGYVGHATVGSGSDSQAGYTLLAGEPVIVEDLRSEQRFSGPPLLHEHGVVSGVSVIISTTEGPYGVLGAHTRRRRPFTRDEVNFLQAIANVLGSAIERHRAEAQLRRVNCAHRALSSCNQAVIRATDESTLLQQICNIIVEEAGYRLCWVGRAENDDAKSVLPVAQAGFEEGYLKTLSITWADTERGRGPTGTCIRIRKTVLAKDIATDPKMIPWRAEALKRGYASSIAIPLLVDSTVFGALMIYAAEPETFGPEEVKLLTELANDLAFGMTALRTRIERARAEQEILTLNAELEQRVNTRTAELQTANKLKDQLLLREQAVTAELAQAREREVEIGYRIQQTLLLDQPPRDIPGLRMAALTIPSQRIDGDFYVFFKHPDQRLDVIVGDVMGKGVPAALLGAATKSHFIEALSHLTALSKTGKLPEPKEIVTLAHAEVARHLINLENFVTLCYARMDLNKRNLDLVDCGHTGIIHLHGRTGLCEMVYGDNLPLGIREGEIYNQISVPFESGDLLLFYSDGVTETRNFAGELFGSDRLLNCVTTNRKLEPEALVEAIRDATVAFSESGRLTDDLTCVAIKIEEPQLALARAEMEIRSDLKELSRAREFVRDFCRNCPAPLDEDGAGALELAVNEAASNIMKHGYHGRADQCIHLDAEAFPGQVSVRLHHLGDPFDPSAISPPVLDGSQESGFGIYLITHSVDEVRYYRDERGRNCIVLVKVRTSEHEGKGETQWK